jgi:hypothetical protein
MMVANYLLVVDEAWADTQPTEFFNFAEHHTFSRHRPRLSPGPDLSAVSK